MNAPLSLAPPLSANERIAELERQMADQQRTLLDQANRIAGLEVALRRRAAAPLARRNAERQANAQRLRAAIVRILAEEGRAGELTRKDVLQALEREGFTEDTLPKPSTVGWHIRALRRTQAVNVNTHVLTPQQ